ncbi:hypothetical protein EB118_23780 [bacterium]|nr:hypothetical protein [bacterium]
MKKKIIAVAVGAAVTLIACAGTDIFELTEGKATSTTTASYLVPVDTAVKFASLLTVGDSINGYRMAGIPDGLGAYDNGDGLTFTVLMNHELGNTNGVARAHGGIGAFVSEWIIDRNTLTVTKGSDLMKSVWELTNGAWTAKTNFAFSRFCSADLAAPSAFYNAATQTGSTARIFLTGEESASATVGRGVAVVASGADKGKAYILPAFGPFATEQVGWENLVAHPNTGDKTVIVATSDGGKNGVYVYIGTKQKTGNEVEKAGLTNGKLYRVVVNKGAAETTADDAGLGFVNGVTTFTLVENVLQAGVAGTSFLRPEDGAWDTKDLKKFYFVTTNTMDAAKDGNANPDIAAGQIGRSRLYSLNFTDINNPTAGGKLVMEMTGKETVTVAGQTHGPQMLDNITVGKDGVLILQEDTGNNIHLAKIWRFDPVTKKLEMIAKFDEPLFGDYRTGKVGTETKDEESSGVIEITDILGRRDGRRYFLVAVQNHKLATGTYATELVEGGQLVVMSY